MAHVGGTRPAEMLGGGAGGGASAEASVAVSTAPDGGAADGGADRAPGGGPEAAGADAGGGSARGAAPAGASAPPPPQPAAEEGADGGMELLPSLTGVPAMSAGATPSVYFALDSRPDSGARRAAGARRRTRRVTARTLAFARAVPAPISCALCARAARAHERSRARVGCRGRLVVLWRGSGQLVVARLRSRASGHPAARARRSTPQSCCTRARTTPGRTHDNRVDRPDCAEREPVG